MSNPFFEQWNTPFGAVPFDRIKEEHFKEAFLEGMRQNLAEIDAIANNPAPATFENTIVAMEKSGVVLDRVMGAFHVLAGAHTNATIQQIDTEVSPLLANHGTAISQNEKLFQRLKDVYQQRASLGAAEKRLAEQYYTNFVRGGADLNAPDKKRMAEIDERLSTLSTLFEQYILAETNAFELELATSDDRAGISDDLLQVFLNNGKQRNKEGRYIVTLSRSSIEPFLTQSTRRDLREIAYKAWKARCDRGNEHDTNAMVKEIVMLRAERARLLGYKTTADYVISDRMAKTPAAAEDLMNQVWEATKKTVGRELADIDRHHKAAGGNDQVQAWDWWYYAEKVRAEKYAISETEVTPYLQLDKMIEGLFYTANKLFGITFKPVTNVSFYHEDVRAWEVTGTDGQHLALFYGDYFSRPSKNGGAWMSEMRHANALLNERPIVYNICNFNKPQDGQPCLLTDDDVVTLFHEFGHALHGMLTKVGLPSLSGTYVKRDFVELPSQLFEHWGRSSHIMERFAVHYKTGQPMPAELREKLKKAGKFNQGHRNAEFMGSALLDMALHKIEDPTHINIAAFESEMLQKIGMPQAVTMRHRLAHFSHIFASGYYAGYYSYLWSAVLDNDAFKAFEETGDIFHKETAKRLHDFIYSAGNSAAPDELYQKFRGRGPSIDALLEYRGLNEAA